MSDLSRSEFLRYVAVTAGAGALGLGALAGCGDDDGGGRPIDASGSADAPPPIDAAIDAPIDAPGPMGNCQMNGTTVTIGVNHGHALVVSKADVAAGVEKTYDIQGTSDHPHSCMITAAMFQTLQANMQITFNSTSGNGHIHMVRVQCV